VTGTLEPGEILYIPPYWWHQIETIDGGNISMPIRFGTSQSPDVPLFQLSQDSSLRPVTNHQNVDQDAMGACLMANRLRFLKRERDFLGSLEATREVRIAPDDLGKYETPADLNETTPKTEQVEGR